MGGDYGTLSPPYLIHSFANAGLWMMPVPIFRGTLSATLKHCAGQDILHLASLLEAHEREALGLTEIQREASVSSIHLYIFPMVDRQAPASCRPLVDLAAKLAEKLHAGESVAVHCKAGIGRSGMLVAIILGRLGFDLPRALHTIRANRGLQAPNTPSQLEWMEKNWAALTAAPNSPG